MGPTRRWDQPWGGTGRLPAQTRARTRRARSKSPVAGSLPSVTLIKITSKSPVAGSSPSVTHIKIVSKRPVAGSIPPVTHIKIVSKPPVAGSLPSVTHHSASRTHSTFSIRCTSLRGRLVTHRYSSLLIDIRRCKITWLSHSMSPTSPSVRT